MKATLLWALFLGLACASCASAPTRAVTTTPSGAAAPEGTPATAAAARSVPTPAVPRVAANPVAASSVSAGLFTAVPVTAPPVAAHVPTPAMSGAASSERAVDTPAPPRTPVQMRARGGAADLARSRRDVMSSPLQTPLQALAAANGAARQRPSRDGFVAARHDYFYEPGALFELYANPNYVSTVLLEPGETLHDIAAGDTSRWMVSEATTESDGEGRAVVLVKPKAAGLRTNIVLITDRRTYLIEAISQPGEAYAAQIAWRYPPRAQTAAQAVSIESLNFGYRVRTVRGATPHWSPTRVFDDGRRTWIEFSPTILATDMPPLFVITGEGRELVNYRVHGTRYMVDRVFDVAELRIGVRKPVVVRIERRATSAAPGAPGAKGARRTSRATLQ